MKVTTEIGMGIGRREFLSLFATAFLATTRAIALVDDLYVLYVNRRLGLAFRKPSSWHFGDVKDMGEMMEGQVFDVSPEGQKIIRSFVTADLPVVTVTKEPLGIPADEFTPGVTVFLDNLLEAQSGPFTDEAKNDIFYCSQLLRGFRLLAAPKKAEVSGCRAADYLATFLWQHAHLPRPVPVNMRTLNINQDPTMYNIRLYDSPYLGRKFEHDYTEFISSIRLV
jgi:hypothetical protein